MRALRGHTTGYAIPQFVIDAPGGGGKIPINPEYVKEVTDTEIIMQNFQGNEYRYPLIDAAQQAIDPEAPKLEPILT